MLHYRFHYKIVLRTVPKLYRNGVCAMNTHISSKKQILQVLMLFVVPLVLFLTGYNFYTMRAMNERVAESNRSAVYLYESSLEKDLQDIDLFLANLVVGDIYHKPAVVTDTHCIRICGRLGLSEGKEPLKVEKQLRAVLPMDEANDFCHRLVLHGRAVCDACKPKCEICCMRAFCKYAQETPVAEKKEGKK